MTIPFATGDAPAEPGKSKRIRGLQSTSLGTDLRPSPKRVQG